MSKWKMTFNRACIGVMMPEIIRIEEVKFDRNIEFIEKISKLELSHEEALIII